MSDSTARPRFRSAIGKQGAWRTLLSHLLIVILPLLGLYVFYVQRQDDNEVDRGFRTLQEAGKRLENDLRALNAWRMPNSSFAFMRAIGLQQVDYEPLAADEEVRRWQQKQAQAAKAFLEKLADTDDRLRSDFINQLDNSDSTDGGCPFGKAKPNLNHAAVAGNGNYYSKDALQEAKLRAGRLLLKQQRFFCADPNQQSATQTQTDQDLAAQRAELDKLYQKFLQSCADQGSEEKQAICVADAVLQGRWLATGSRQQQVKFNQHRIAGLSYLNTLPEQHIDICKGLPNQDGAIAFESNSSGGAALSFPCESGKLVQAFAIKADARQLFLGITAGMQFDELLLADADGQLLFSPLMTAPPRLSGDRSGYQPFVEQADLVALQALLQEAARKERYELRQLNSLGEKTDPKNEPSASVKTPDGSTLLNVELGGQRHRVFIQPYRIAIPQLKSSASMFAPTVLGSTKDETDKSAATATIQPQTMLYLVGLRRHQPIKSVAPDTPFAATFILVLVAAIVLSVPFIKLHFLDHDDPLPRSLLPLLLLCLPGLAAGLILLGETVLLYRAEQDRLELLAKQTATQLRNSFTQELDQALQQLHKLAELDADKIKQNSTHPEWQAVCHDLSGNVSWAKSCPQFRLVEKAKAAATENPTLLLPAYQLPWLAAVSQADDKGSVKQRWFFREPVANRYGSSLTSREYYRHLRDGKADELGGALLRHEQTGQLFDLQRVINFTDGRNTTQLSIRKQQEDFGAGLLTAEMLDMTFLAPVLPAGFRYSVIDNGTGLVLFDSSSRRELTENFYNELADAKILRALIHRHASNSFSSNYHNRPSLLHVQPLPHGLPWTLLVHYDRTPEQQRLMAALRLAALAFVIYGLVLLVLIYWLPRLVSGRDLWRWPLGQHRLRFTWAWPQWRLRHAYVDYQFALGLQLLFCLLALFCVEMAGWQALLFCFGQTSLALGSGVLLLQCLHHRRPTPVDVVQRPLLTGAVLAATWLLMLLAVGWRWWALLLALLHLLWVGLVYLHESPQIRVRAPDVLHQPLQQRIQAMQNLARRALVLQRRCLWRDSRLSQSKYERRYLSCVLLLLLLIGVAPAHLFMKKSLQVQQQAKLHDDLLTLTEQLDRRGRALVTKTRLLEPTCSDHPNYLLAMPAPHDFGIAGASHWTVQAVAAPAAVPASASGLPPCLQPAAPSHARHHLHYRDVLAATPEASALQLRAERQTAVGRQTSAVRDESAAEPDIEPIPDLSTASDWFELLASLLPLDHWLGAASGLAPSNADWGNGWQRSSEQIQPDAITTSTNSSIRCMDAESSSDCVSLALPSIRYRYLHAVTDVSRASASLLFLLLVCAVIWLLARLTAVQYAGLHRSRARYLQPQRPARRPQHYVLMQPALTQQSWRQYADDHGYLCCSIRDTLPDSGTILLIGLEAELGDDTQRATLLNKLETALCDDSAARRICLISDCQPLSRLFQPEQYPNLLDDKPMSAYQQAQCARILASCEPIDRIEELPSTPLPSALTLPTDASGKHLVAGLIRRECALFEPELCWIEAELLEQHQRSLLNEDGVFRYVVKKAQFIYRHKWEQCSIPERLALYHLASGCDLNPATRAVGESLLSRGYIRAEPSLQIANRSFAEFVSNAETPLQFEQWAELRPHGLWHSIRVPILLLLVMLLGWIAWTAGSTFSTLTVIIGGVLGLMTQMMSGLSLLRSQFGQPSAK